MRQYINDLERKNNNIRSDINTLKCEIKKYESMTKTKTTNQKNETQKPNASNSSNNPKNDNDNKENNEGSNNDIFAFVLR